MQLILFREDQASEMVYNVIDVLSFDGGLGLLVETRLANGNIEKRRIQKNEYSFFSVRMGV